MRRLVLALAVFTSLAAASAQDAPTPAAPSDQHKWLQQLVGEWTATAEASMGPDTEPMKLESTERVRSVGGLWIVAEGSATMGGAAFTSIMTLGYDTRTKAFVGTWVDTMQPHMWIYRGTLDPGGKVLTLDTEGPSFDDPAKTAKYRDVIEIKGADTKLLTSSVLGDDGSWTTFMRAEYRRRK